MTRKEFLSGRAFVVSNIPGWDWQYSEDLYGGEVRISNERHARRVEVEEITQDYFVVECWLNNHTDGRIYFQNCDLKE